MNACSKCGLSLPNNYLTPVVMRNQSGQTKKGFLCISCKTLIDSQQKGNGNVQNSG
jgi:hypothetical protein